MDESFEDMNTGQPRLIWRIELSITLCKKWKNTANSGHPLAKCSSIDDHEISKSSPRKLNDERHIFQIDI
jgi:hypothetical protein